MLKVALEVVGLSVSVIGVAMFSLPVALIVAGALVVVVVERN